MRRRWLGGRRKGLGGSRSCRRGVVGRVGGWWTEEEAGKGSWDEKWGNIEGGREAGRGCIFGMVGEGMI